MDCTTVSSRALAGSGCGAMPASQPASQSGHQFLLRSPHWGETGLTEHGQHILSLSPEPTTSKGLHKSVWSVVI